MSLLFIRCHTHSHCQYVPTKILSRSTYVVRYVIDYLTAETDIKLLNLILSWIFVADVACYLRKIISRPFPCSSIHIEPSALWAADIWFILNCTVTLSRVILSKCRASVEASAEIGARHIRETVGKFRSTCLDIDPSTLISSDLYIFLTLIVLTSDVPILGKNIDLSIVEFTSNILII